MRSHPSWLGFLGTLPLAILPAPAGAQAVGSEFQVNTYTTGAQEVRAIASDPSGNFVVVWPGAGQGDSAGIFGQRYDSGGVALGDEFRVNSYTTGSQNTPSVAADPAGNFLVVWAGASGDVVGQRYDSDGVALGGEFRVNSYTTYGQWNPSVAFDADGDFVVVWASRWQEAGAQDGVFAQRFDSEGAPKGTEFHVNSYTTNDQTNPKVVSDTSGNFLVVWDSRGQDGSQRGIFGQRYDNAGMAQGDEFRVNSYTTGPQYAPFAASDARGNFVVVWNSRNSYSGPFDIVGKRYDSAGNALGNEFRVTSFNSGFGTGVASDANGNFMVAWSRNEDGSNWGIFGRRYNSGGVAQGNEFPINSFTTGYQVFPFAAATGENQFVVTWTSEEQDGNGTGVFGQRYAFSGAATITIVSPNTNVKWRIGSQKEIRWTHNLGVNASFRIKLDRNDDGEYEELIAAAAPADSATSGSFAWTVTGPPSKKARVRVVWTNDPSVSDSSDATFQIKPAEVDGEP
jgi:hypothetical protein